MIKKFKLATPIFELCHVTYSRKEHFDKIAWGLFIPVKVPISLKTGSPLGPHYEVFWVPLHLGAVLLGEKTLKTTQKFQFSEKLSFWVVFGIFLSTGMSD